MGRPWLCCSTVKPRCFLVPKVAFPHRPCRCGVDNETILAESKGSSDRGLDVCFGMPDFWYNFLCQRSDDQKTPKGVVQLDLSTGDFSHFWSFVKLKFDKSDSSTNLIVVTSDLKNTYIDVRRNTSLKISLEIVTKVTLKRFCTFVEILCPSTPILNPKEFTLFLLPCFPKVNALILPKAKVGRVCVIWFYGDVPLAIFILAGNL